MQKCETWLLNEQDNDGANSNASTPPIDHQAVLLPSPPLSASPVTVNALPSTTYAAVVHGSSNGGKTPQER